jgi:hypothetical protein
LGGFQERKACFTLAGCGNFEPSALTALLHTGAV